MKRSNKLADNNRQKFEELLPKGLDCTLNEAGDYVHKTVQAMWLGFMLSLHRGNKKRTETFRPVNAFVIARSDANNVPRFSPHPRTQSLGKAEVELNRLAKEVPGHTFTLWQMVDTAFVEKSPEQKETCFYSHHRIYHHFDVGSTFRNYFITDDYGDSVRPKIYQWVYAGEIVERRVMINLSTPRL